MKPVKKKIMNEMLEYHEVIDYIEKKYKIDVRDYAAVQGVTGKISHFERYQNETGDKMPFDGNYPDYFNDQYRVYRNGKMVPTSKKIYEDDLTLIYEHFERFKQWSKLNPEPPYLDYWHWLIDNCFYEVQNPCRESINVTEILENNETPKWVKEITQLIYDEFKDELDSDGALEVWISW